jgi:TPR repeat protein
MGKGVPRDQVQAYKWMLLSAQRGDKTLENVRQDLAGQLTSDELSTAQHSADEWTLNVSRSGPEP